ncbi:hypothetical protein MMC26_002460 [Xylographa opegraphella]|nr:hypothetical protein [Xylographa opegraphella]
MATKAKVSPFKTKLLKISGLTVCRAAYSPAHTPPFVAAAILSEPNHILYPPTKKRYDTRSRETLWWNVTSNTMSTVKKVMRSWNNRRMRRAIIEALATCGLDAEGKPAAGDGERRAQGLKGTLIIHALPIILSTKFVDVKLQMELLIRDLIQRGS